MKKLMTFAAVLLFGIAASTGTSHAATRLVTVGPTVGGCATAVSAELIRPVALDTPLQLAIGVRAGSAATRCTTVHDEIRVSAQLWALPGVLTPHDSVAVLMTAHGACGVGGCTYAAAFAQGTMPPGIYEVKGFVEFKSGSTFSPVTTFYGQRFLYTGVDIAPI